LPGFCGGEGDSNQRNENPEHPNRLLGAPPFAQGIVRAYFIGHLSWNRS
jgi:hypothetical protein